MESSNLLVDLVIALIAALAGAAIAVRLGQSAVVGFIIAGVAIGPYTPGPAGDVQTVEALAEIGVILLMFTIGVQFSLRELFAAGKVASLGSTIQVVATIALGAGVGTLIGWGIVESLFFGAVLSNSSSTVLSKVLGDRGEMDSPQGQLALAWSTVQDLGTVVLIVLLTALASDSDSVVRNVVLEVGKATVFLILLVPVGLRVLPWLFERVAEMRNRELFVLTVAAIALGLAYGASYFGLSLALGAFVAGIVVGESDLSHRILGEALPLRDIFAGIFFVSVGMLVDPRFLIDNFALLILTVILIVVVKALMVGVIATALGTPLRTAILSGAILGQSAEFSFLLARVGQDENAVSQTAFGLMLAGAAASIVLVPASYSAAGTLAARAQAWLPQVSGGTGSEGAVPIDPHLTNHAIICGYGRVGRVVGGVVGRRFRMVAIDEDPRIVRALREQGRMAVQGNAAVPAVLEQTFPERARVLVVALPEPVAARQIVDYAREHYPRLHLVVRTHSESERRYLLDRGVNEVILGEWELALEMTHHSLRRLGLSILEAQAIIQRLRGRDDDADLFLRSPGHVDTNATPWTSRIRSWFGRRFARDVGLPDHGVPESDIASRFTVLWSGVWSRGGRQNSGPTARGMESASDRGVGIDVHEEEISMASGNDRDPNRERAEPTGAEQETPGSAGYPEPGSGHDDSETITVEDGPSTEKVDGIPGAHGDVEIERQQ
jgi:monovalent cation:H+ antiporter-2, CPA2 family